MTRRRIIAGVILLAAVAVAIPAAPGVWEKMAYEQIPITPGSHFLRCIEGGRTTSTRFVGGTDLLAGKVDPETVVVESCMLIVHEKRHAWLPGRAFIIPDQVCMSCEMAEHTLCFPRYTKTARFITLDGRRVDLPAHFQCTCTYPSHAQEPE